MMIKNTKKGFSLAELLITLAVISIIATLGFTIAQKGIERAYNHYIYTGYRGLYDLISAANNDGESLLADQNEFVEKAYEYFDKEEQNNNFTIKTPNNISYYIDTQTGKNMAGELVENYGKLAVIYMKVPSARKYNRNTGEVQTSVTIPLRYTELGFTNNILIPMNSVSEQPQHEFFDGTGFIPNIANRIDLLPFYVDDGSTGIIKNIYNSNNKTTTTMNPSNKRTYYSAKDAVCKTQDYASDVLKIGFDCSETNSNKIDGVIKVANPRKIF